MKASLSAIGLLALTAPAEAALIQTIIIRGSGFVTASDGGIVPPVGAPNNFGAGATYDPPFLPADATGEFDLGLADMWGAGDDYSVAFQTPGLGGYIRLLDGVVTGFSFTGAIETQGLQLTDATFTGFLVELTNDEEIERFYSGVWTEWSATVVTTAVPEPASWGLMIAGFGLVGGAVRSRRVRGSVPA